MKKIFYILLVMTFSFTLTSCGNGGEMEEANEMEMKEEATDMVDEATETAPEEKGEGEESEMESEEGAEEKAEGM